MATHFSPQLITQLLGTKVLSAQKENIGVIQDLLIDHEEGSISYLMLCYDDFMGTKHKYFLIPSFLLERAEPGSRSLMLNVHQQQLVEAPEIDGFGAEIPDTRRVLQINGTEEKVSH